MKNLLRKLALGSSAAALAASLPTGAFAQNDTDIEQVVVSASRISIAGYSQPTPVTVVGAAQLEQDAYSDIQDSIRELPQVTSPPSNVSANSGGLGGSNGEQNINLRNLGVIRTLVLFDGQRVVTSPLSNSAVDVTTLPQIVVQRVDVVTGGASAAWGSDAVAGVVNFVINKNFTGFKATAQASDTTNNLYRGLSVGGMWGGDIFGGRGHVEIAIDAKTNPDTVLLPQEHWFKNPYWVSNPAYAPGNGQPQLIVGYNVGLATATTGGIINSSPAGVAGPGVTPAAANALHGIEFVGAGIPQVVNYGNVTLGSLSNGGSLNANDGQWPFDQIALPGNSYTFFGFGRYKLTDTVQASLQVNYGYYTGRNSAGINLQTALTVRSDNAYIPPSVAAAMKAGGISSFALGTLTINNFNNATATGANFYAQAGDALGPISSTNRRNIVRGVFTLDGTLGDEWSWNAYIQHSAARYSAHALGDPILANLQAAQDAVTVTSANVGKSNLALGSIACRSALPGQSAVTLNGVSADPGCIPLNVFGTGVASPAAVGYITGAANNDQDFVHQSFQQDVAEGSVQGTLPWALPAGKIAVAIGVGYRKEQAMAVARYNITAVGGYAQGDFPSFQGRHVDIIEGFGEVDAPILKNNIVNALDFTMAGRMTSYSTSGLVETWKLGATSQINDDIKLRTTWSIDIRAPQLYELYNLGSIGPQNQRDPKTQLTVQVLQQTTGDPNLVPEVARTISGGVVLTPTFIPGLSLSADWYSIDITGEITTLSTATILNQCNATLPSQIYPGTKGSPGDPLCKNLVFGGPGGALSQINLSPINIASQTTSGLDLQANYVMDFWDGTLAWASTDSYNDENTISNPGSGVNDLAGAFTGGSGAPIAGPKWRGVLSATYNTGPYMFTIQSRWFGTAVTQQGGDTGNLASAVTANLYDPAHFEVPFTAYLDLRANYKWNDNISFFGAIDNSLNTPPPLEATVSGTTTVGSQILGTPSTFYDLLGRSFRVGIRLNY